MTTVTALVYLTILLVGVVLSCLVSTMALFMGGGQGTVDLFGLLAIQSASIPAALVAVFVALYLTRVAGHSPLTVQRIYAAVPQWLVFIVLILAMLVGFGEVAFVVVERATGNPIAWRAHVPLLSMLFCSLAVAVLYACIGLMSGRPQAMSGRWSGR